MSKTKDFELVEKQNADLKSDIKWYGKEDQTDLFDIHDKGQGEKIIIRLEEFKLNPNLEKLPKKENLLTPEYLKFIDAKLWGDGLRRVMEPKVNITKEWARIFIPCVPATGQSILEETKLLQEYV